VLADITDIFDICALSLSQFCLPRKSHGIKGLQINVTDFTIITMCFSCQLPCSTHNHCLQ